MKPLRDEIEVEPLSDKTWSRIDRRMQAELPIVATPRAGIMTARSRVARTASVAFLAAAVLLAGIWSWQRGRGAVGEPSWIVTESSASHVRVGDNWLDIGARSAVVVSGDDERGVLVMLDHGSVTCEVAPRRGRPPFLVNAGSVQVRVVGTRFSVRRAGETVEVSVVHGVVAVSKDGRVRYLRAGETWSSADGLAASAGRVSPAAADRAPVPQLAALRIGSSVAPEIPPAPQIVARRVGAPVAPEIPPAPQIVARRVGAPVAPEIPPAPQIVARRVGAHVTHAAEHEHAVLARPTPAAPPSFAPSPIPEDRRGMFETASRLEARDPRAAAAAYDHLSHGNDLWAANALFANARLALERGDRPLAHMLASRYLQRFPAGPNADDARSLIDSSPQR